ncbi:hypothetical protein ACM66B_002507 [Microbotryomycetes sp. NB124-2]
MQRGRAPPRQQHQQARPPPRKPVVKVNRREVPPTLVRVFARLHSHHSDNEFAPSRLPLRDEIQVFAWRDTTLRELLVLLRDAAPDLRTAPLAKFSIRHVYFDTRDDRFVSKDLALVPAKDLNNVASHGREVNVDSRLSRTLAEVNYVAGDFFDVAYLTTNGPPGAPGAGPLMAGSGQFAVAGTAGRNLGRGGWPSARGIGPGPGVSGRPPQDHPWVVRGSARRQSGAGNRDNDVDGDAAQEKSGRDRSPDGLPKSPQRSRSKSPMRRESPPDR